MFNDKKALILLLPHQKRLSTMKELKVDLGPALAFTMFEIEEVAFACRTVPCVDYCANSLFCPQQASVFQKEKLITQN